MTDNENMIQFIEIARNSNLTIRASYEVSYTTTIDFKSFEVNFCFNSIVNISIIDNSFKTLWLCVLKRLR